MRAPIWLYRARLGVLLGNRLLMLEHTGRTSGQRRFTVLEVIGHPSRDVYIVASGFGTRAQWFRNVEANPNVSVSVASRTSVPATARNLCPAEAGTALRAYTERHPTAWEAMKPAIESTLGAEIDTADTALPMVELTLRNA